MVLNGIVDVKGVSIRLTRLSSGRLEIVFTRFLSPLARVPVLGFGAPSDKDGFGCEKDLGK